jgi:hypothetical protein
VLAGWTLAGGTGLALHLGHRASDDFDFFRTQGMEAKRLGDVLAGIGSCEILQHADDTLTVLLESIKLSFFQIPDPFLDPPRPFRWFHVASPRDIALMKLAAISSRGSRKDFVDLYSVLCTGPSLGELFADLPRKYGQDRVNVYHILKSLTYFEDAEREPMPRMLEPLDWDECKAFLIRHAHSIVL